MLDCILGSADLKSAAAFTLAEPQICEISKIKPYYLKLGYSKKVSLT